MYVKKNCIYMKVCLYSIYKLDSNYFVRKRGMTMPVFQFGARLLAVLLCAVGLLLPTLSAADTYPVKPIRIVIGFTPGGNTDIFGRMFAERLQKNLGQPVIVENRPGAATMIASEYVAKSNPDGHTICLCVTNVATNKFVYAKVPYSMSEFVPVSLMFTSVTGLIVPAGSPFKSVSELVEYARKNPGKLNYSTTGAGGATHVVGALFTSVAGIDAVPVHYKGAAPAALAAVSGEVDFTFSTITTAMPYLQGGRARMLALAGKQRMQAVSDVPTMAEAGYPGVVTSVWYGLLAPKGTPKSVIDILNRETKSFVNQPEVGQRMLSTGEQPQGNLSPGEFSKYIEQDTEFMQKIMEPLNLKL